MKPNMRTLVTSLALVVGVVAAAGAAATTKVTEAPAKAKVKAKAPAKPARPKKPELAAKKPVEDRYHGVAITDDYRWLENGADPDTLAFVQAHRDFARATLDALPQVAPIEKRLLAIDDAEPVKHWPFRVGTRWYATRKDPGKNQAVLVTLGGPEDAAGAKVVFDPNTIEPLGLVSVDFMVPSYDGKKLAVSLSERGSESGTLYVYDLATGQRLADVIPGVNYGTGGGGVTWLADSSGFYYTRYPRPGERPDADLRFYQQVYRHTLGSPVAKDTYVFGKDLPKIAMIGFVANDLGTRLALAVKNGDGGEVAFFLLGAGDKVAPISKFTDRIVDARFGQEGALYLLSLDKAKNGKIVRLAPGQTELFRASLIVPEGKGRIDGFVAGKSKLFVSRVVGGPSELSVYGLGGGGGDAVPVPAIAQVSNLTMVDPQGDELMYGVQTYLEPLAFYRVSLGGEPRRSPLSHKSSVDFSAYEVERVMVPSKDGTQVPLNLIHKKGLARNGQQPTILNGYGGYGLSQQPAFGAARIVWLSQGGVYAFANLRGGAEFGEAWHEQGMLTKKQNVFDDFIACAEWLVAAKVTSSKRLAIQGGSNGGLLMGAVLVQRPELFAAVLSRVGIYDMLRVELSPNGEFNTTEFGTVKDKTQFLALYAYSPYHHVTDGRAYPPVLLMTGTNDPRVDPMQSRKFAARLAAAGAKEVLLLQDDDAGHGVVDRTSRVRQGAHGLAFIMARLGMTYRAPK